MNDWPEGWGDSQGGGDRGYGRGSASARPEGARAMPHVQRGQGGGPRRSAPPRPTVPAQPSYGEGYGDQYDSGYNTGQVYGGGGGRGGGGYVPNDNDPADGYAPPRPRPNWRRRIKWAVLTLVVVFVGVSIGTYFWADSKLHRDVDLSKVIERPETGQGTNYLIVGTDSRAGMSDAEKKKLHTGSAEGKRTDTMMILHTGDNGSTMISLPRDSNVTIPSYKGSDSGKLYPNQGRQVKLNAAYAEDGPELLVRTVEFNTGLHIDHYAEIGFGGFAKIVDAVGGVEMNLKEGFKDKWSGADFQKGKQTLNGQQALAFVRTRHAFAASDLQRTKNQQAFLSALAHQVATPSTVMNPFKLYPTMGAGLDSLVVDKDMSLWDLGSMFFAMKGVTGGDGKSMNMPVSGSVNGNLVWDKTKVKQLVGELKNDETVTVSGN
ncbi:MULTISPECIES: LCP family protein [unclassified Streptomyces]|uniref:LCP family protein n=1 Tax=Streptomyces sp. NBC_00119 TaxID=2975659 RepID=A0AAU1UE95_9ACTN|nr:MULTISPECIES: LCP family protein [unclassified Streptomyces]MCX4645023.1 LCP family protein [Streptomyces sp. NBC_01446]MCX5326207.1 LCP family protein [Streptomyces sp. NBC_00120]